MISGDYLVQLTSEWSTWARALVRKNSKAGSPGVKMLLAII
jgi:hypothetical protein